MTFAGARPECRPLGERPSAHQSLYYLGSVEDWRANSHFEQVRYKEIYPGIDAVFVTNAGRLEYNFELAPHADPSAIRILYDGATVALAPTGDLVIRAAGVTILQKRPRAFQEARGRRRSVTCGYRLRNGRDVTLHLGDHNPNAKLVIDPVLVFSTYAGGSSLDAIYGMVADPSGNLYVTGETASGSLWNASAPSRSSRDAFVAKLNPTATQVLFTVYLGGSGRDAGKALAVDGAGNVYVTGVTSSSDFPVTNSAISVQSSGVEEAFVAKLDSHGGLQYSTYLGGAKTDSGLAIAVDASGSAYVAGQTESTIFPVTSGALQTSSHGGSSDCFVSKLNPAGTSLVYSTFLGGSALDLCSAIALDAGGNVYVGGTTYSTDFPTQSPLQSALRGTANAFVAKINGSGSALVCSTFLGGSNVDEATSIAVDAAGAIYIAGTASSMDFPVTSGSVQTTLKGAYNAFVSKLSPDGSALIYSFLLGGSKSDAATSIAIDQAGRAFISGYTTSPDFPMSNAVQSTFQGAYDAFASVIDANGSSLVFSSYFGGSNDDRAYAVTAPPGNKLLLAGTTSSSDFVTAAATQPWMNVASDAFLLEVGGIAPATSPPASAAFIKLDAVTQGSWEGVYGKDGCIVIGDSSYDPSYVNPAPSGQVQAVWAPLSNDLRALQRASSPSTRIAGVWYSSTSFTVDLNITDGNTHQLAAYLLDWDTTTRREKIEILDAAGNTLDTQNLTSSFSSGVFLVWSVTGHVKLRVTLTGGPNAVLSGLFFGASNTATAGPGSATFVRLDSTTRGNWRALYGAEGYVIVGDQNSNPSYGTLAAAGQYQAVWAMSTGDARALQKASNPADRVAGAWYSTSSFTVDLNLTDGNTHQIAAYCMDWDTTARRERLDILDTAGTVLDSQSLTSSFNGGVYLVWNISGHVKLRVTLTGGANPILSGLFFGASSTTASAALSISKSHASNFAQGQQNAIYTVSVSNAAGAAPATGAVTVAENLPAGLVLVSMLGNGWVCGNGNCTRSDGLASGSSYPPITVTVNVAGNATSPQVNQVNVSGGGSPSANAADSTIVVPAGSASSSASFVRLDTTTLGNWPGTYGSDGYVVIGNRTQNPAYVAPTTVGQLQYVWGASTADSRALTKPASPPDRIAATWYAFNSFTMDLNMTDSNMHQLAVYALDWDTTARRETVDILDGNGNVLNSQSLTSSFHSGVYLVWNVSGHIAVRVTLTGGANAVLSGIFFGGGSSPPPFASASLVKLDTTTHGNWRNVYGADGYQVVGDQTLNPSYVTPAPSGQNQAVWTGSSSDVRALQKPSNSSDRIAGVWYAASSFTVDLNITDGNTHQFAVYCLDWDTSARRQTLDILDWNGSVLSSQSLTSSFNGGMYVVWNVSGHVKLRVTLNGGANPVISGMFFH